MVDIDLSIMNNPELGKAANSPYLDEIEAQAMENARAAAENREPLKVLPRERYGEYAGTPNVGPLLFEEGTPVFPETNLNDYFQSAENVRVALSQKVADEFEKEDQNSENEEDPSDDDSEED